MSKVWKDPKERIIFLLVIFAFVILCIVEPWFSVIPPLKNYSVAKLLISNSSNGVISGFLISVISAYVFYLFIDYLPRLSREKKSIYVLNSLIASILDAYNRKRVFGHETAISNVDRTVLDVNWLDSQIETLQNNRSQFLALKFAMETAHSRIEDFRHSLPLAVHLSPDRALQWLVITDKIRLLAELYEKYPNVPKGAFATLDEDSDKNPIRTYKSSLNFRVLEIVEESLVWIHLEKNG